MRKYKLKDLGKKQLSRLRQDITLCSIFLSDYTNRYQIDTNKVFDFFDAYSEYLRDLMLEDGYADENYFDLISSYDTIENLFNYHHYIYNFNS